MKFLACNDLHFDHRRPASRIDDYQGELLDLLDQIRQLAIGTQCAAVLIAGDIFNSTKQTFQSVYRLYLWCQALQEAGIRVFAIPGNHDLESNRLDTLKDTPLGLLFAVEAMIDVSNRSLLTIPIGPAEVAGVPFPDAFDLAKWAAVEKSKTGVPSLIMGHCFAGPEPGDHWGEPVLGYRQLAELPWDVFIFGHDHSDGGVTKIGEKWFINLPALARGALTDEAIRRDVKVALIDTNPLAVRQVRLKAKPAEEIFDLSARDAQKQEQAEIEAFVARLREDLAGTGAGVHLDARVANLSLADDVRERVLQYLREAERAN